MATKGIQKNSLLGYASWMIMAKYFLTFKSVWHRDFTVILLAGINIFLAVQ